MAGQQEDGEGAAGKTPPSLSGESFPAPKSSKNGARVDEVQMLTRSEGEEEGRKRESLSLTSSTAVAGRSNGNNDNNYSKGGGRGESVSVSTTAPSRLEGLSPPTKDTTYSNRNNSSNGDSNTHSSGDNNNHGNHNKTNDSNSSSTKNSSGTSNSGDGSISQSTTVKMSFAGVAAQTQMYIMSLDDMKQKMQEQKKYTRIEEGTATILPPAEELEATEKRTVVFRCVATKSRRLEVATNTQIERALRTQWKHVLYVSRAKQYGVIEVLFETEDLARQQSVQPVISEEFIMFPTYMGKKTTTIKIRNIPPGMDLWRIASCVAPDAESSVLLMKRSEVDKFSGTSLEILIQATPEVLEKIPHHIALPKGRDLNVMVEGRKPRCHTCGALDHLRAFCPRRRASAGEWRRAPPPLPHTPAPDAATKEVSRGSGGAAAAAVTRRPRAAETSGTEAAPAVTTAVAGEAMAAATTTTPPTAVSKLINRTTQGKPQHSNPPSESPIPPLPTCTYTNKTTHTHTHLTTPENSTDDTATTPSEEGQYENRKKRKTTIHETPPTHTSKQNKTTHYNYMLIRNTNKDLMAIIAETEDISVVEEKTFPTGVNFKKDQTVIKLPVEACRILTEKHPKDVGCPSVKLTNRLSQDLNLKEEPQTHMDTDVMVRSPVKQTR